ncbi:MAG TPA: hypothetical protein VIK35_02185 [Verrucomicrobiae bacterium]
MTGCDTVAAGPVTTMDGGVVSRVIVVSTQVCCASGGSPRNPTQASYLSSPEYNGTDGSGLYTCHVALLKSMTLFVL